jgi:hypothetical protein
MDLKKLFEDKSIKPKEKVETVSKWLLAKKLTMDTLIEFAASSKDPVKAGCIEGVEFATKTKPEIATASCLEFVTESLAEKAPRIKWESAKVIGNVAHLFPGKMDKAIGYLLTNSEHSGTVVRWSAAFAIGEIMKSDKKQFKKMLPAVEAIMKREEKNSIKKIYIAAIKSV